MARVAAEELERLKREVGVADLARARGVALSGGHGELRGLCPFHADTDPSLLINTERNVWVCLGACNVGGSVIDWVMRAEGLRSFTAVIQWLRDYTGGRTQVSTGPVVAQSTVSKLACPLTLDAPDSQLMAEVVQFYADTLAQHPEAKAYLLKRGLTSEKLWKEYRLGFCDRTLGLRLPLKNRDAGAAIRSRLQGLGVLRESGHEHLVGSVTIPVLSQDGEVVQLYGRKVTDGLRPGTPQHLYLPGPHRGVFNAAKLVGQREVILCEALLDALTFVQCGFENVTTAFGVHGFTDELQQFLKAQGVERVYIAFDRDDAGNAGADAVSEKLRALGIGSFRVEFPYGQDANAVAVAAGDGAREVFEKALKQGSWMAGPAQRRAAREGAPAPVPVSRAEEAAPAPAENVVAAEIPLVAGVAVDTAGQDQVLLRFGERAWRVRGLSKNTSHEVLRVNVRVGERELVHVETLDLYSAKQRSVFQKAAALELGASEENLGRELGRIILALEQIQDAALAEKLRPQEAAAQMTEQEHAAAMAFLKSEDLFEQVLGDFERCGTVGEETNKLVAYLAATSRKLSNPLAIMVQSSSAAGKSSLMEAVLAFMPEEERQKYSAMTGQSLYYVGEHELAHKILAVVEEEGAERASYALKLLQSEGELTIASTGKDPGTGKLETKQYHVEGPVMIFVTTTSVDLDEELLNRCIMLTVDESREQTRAIHKLQRRKRTLDGLFEREEREAVVVLHQNAQRLLRSLKVVNPYAEALTFLDDKTRTRRDHEKYLTLMDSIALLRQYQRPLRRETRGGHTVEYVEVTQADVELAQKLAGQVLGRTLDELPPQTRRFLGLLHTWADGVCGRTQVALPQLRFTRRAVREALGWSYDQVRVHLERLIGREFVLVHRGTRGQQFVYELVYSGGGQDGLPFLLGTTTTGAAESLGGVEASLGPPEGEFGPPLEGVWRAIGGGLDPVYDVKTPRKNGKNGHLDKSGGENARWAG